MSRSRSLRSAGAFAIPWVVAGCAFIPTSPPIFETSRAASLPEPAYEDLAVEEARTLPSEAGFRLPLWEEDAVASASSNGQGPSEVETASASLSDRLTVRPRGTAARDGVSEPVSRLSDDPSRSLRDDSLWSRRDRLLAELALFRERDERSLRDGDRLKKHRIQKQLMALHFLLEGDDLSHLEPIIASLEEPIEPAREHALLEAAFYESIDLEDRSEAVLARLDGRAADRDFRISTPIPCATIEGRGRYQPVDREKFRPGEALRLYSDVYGLRNLRVGKLYRQELEVQIFLLDAKGEERDRVTVATETSPTPEPVVDSFLIVPYTLPEKTPFGEVRLVLSVKDLNSGSVARQERALRIAP